MNSARFHKPALCLALVAALTLAAGPADADISKGTFDFAGSVATELRIFPGERSYEGQDRSTLSPSIAATPEFVYEWDGGSNRLTFIPFARIDVHDENRSHWDIREAHWLHAADNWDLTAGLGKVFWGVTESRHLVDIINQTDAVENIDGEDKLGQPMVQFNWHTDNGSLGLFVLPGFRERTFADDEARLRGSKPVRGADATYDSSADAKHIDLAARWSHTIDNLDFAISHFHGTSREPTVVEAVRDGKDVFIPHYDQIDQTGLELQLTTGAWLWKMEAMTRSGHGNRFAATAAGLEYTLYQIADSAADLGLLAEYLYDGRGASAPAVASNNDVFVGARLVLNDTADTEILAGAIIDRLAQEIVISIEAAHRLSDHWKAEVEVRWSANVPDSGFFAGAKNDDFVLLRAERFF